MKVCVTYVLPDLFLSSNAQDFIEEAGQASTMTLRAIIPEQ